MTARKNGAMNAPVPNEIIVMLEAAGIAGMLYGALFNFRSIFDFYAGRRRVDIFNRILGGAA